MPLAPLEVFVPGPLYNPMNGAKGGHWAKRHRWARTWRERTAERLRVAILIERREWARVDPRAPKLVTFHAQTFNAFDGDGLSSALKPCRDALKDARLIDDDRDSAGHQFVYTQEIKRKERGVKITITPRTEGRDGD